MGGTKICYGLNPIVKAPISLGEYPIKSLAGTA
jgi:hypothetical protein